MFKRNEEIRIARGSIPNWAIAERLGISENTFLRKMRYEMNEKDKNEVLMVIEQIKSEMQKEVV